MQETEIQRGCMLLHDKKSQLSVAVQNFERRVTTRQW